MSESKSEEVSENNCVVCCREVYIYAIGECDHPVCFECATRMRVLCRQNECPICRRELPKIIFVKDRKQYSEVKNVVFPFRDRRYNLYFEDSFVQLAHHKLLEHSCYICEKKPTFQTFDLLKDHVRRTHELFFCEICTKHLLIFTCERKCYNRQELATHKRRGDLDDTSHRGHPLCEFCDDRFLDDDELFRHLRREHFFCHFCDTDGHNHYYSDYEYLRKHFRAEHFLCEEGECINEKFTTAFRSEIDLIAHRASAHNRGLTKAQAKQARTLDLEFSIAPRSASNAEGMPNRSYYEVDDANARRGRRRGGYSNRGGGREFPHSYHSRNDNSEEIQESSNSLQNHVPPSPKIDMSSRQDFPILGSALSNPAASSAAAPSANSAPDTMARKLAKINRFTVGSGLGNDEFPALHSGSGGPAMPKVASKFKGSNSWGSSGSATLSLTSSQAPSPSAGSRKTLTVKLNSQDDFPGLGNEKRHRPVPNVSIQVDHKQNLAKPSSGSNASSTGSSERQPIITRMAGSQNITFLNSPTSMQPKSNPAPGAVQATSEVRPPEFVQGLPKTDSGWYVLKKGKSTKSKSPPDEAKLTPLSLEEDFPSLALRNMAQKTRKEPRSNQLAQNTWKVELDVNKSPENGNSSKSTLMAKGKKKKKVATNGIENGNGPKTTVTLELNNTENEVICPNGITPHDADVHSEEEGGGKVKRSELKLNVVTPSGNCKNPQAVTNPDIFSAEDFPNLAQKKPTGLPAKRRSELKVNALASPVITSSIVPNEVTEMENLKNGNIFIADDFPNLTSKSANKVSAPPGFDARPSCPPPGFVSVAPPPGFNTVDVVLPTSQRSGSAATFTNSIGRNFSFPQPIPCHAYAQPEGFQRRNHELTERLHRILDGNVEKFATFKDISGRFRKGGISAEEYYDRCVDLMSEPRFNGIFPELIVLLPDIAKQQELLAVYNATKAVASPRNQISGAPFLVCASCQQVLTGKDFRSHESSHSLDNNFPSLDNLIHTSHIDWVKRN